MPIFLGAEGPKNVTQTAEIADGWLPLYYSPYRQEVYADQLKAAKPGFEISAMAIVSETDTVEEGLMPVKAMLGFYIGGMGAKNKNFYHEYATRLGYGDAADQIQDLYLSGKKSEAEALVPNELLDEVSLVGPRERIIERHRISDSQATSNRLWCITRHI